MEIKTSTPIPTTTITTTTTTTTTTTPETETPPTKHLSKGFSFTNGAFKLHNHNSTPLTPPVQPLQGVVVYKECLKNHAAALGGHALDGCGEFMPSPTSTDPTCLKCAACGCHRNFHRRDPEEQGTRMIEYLSQPQTLIPTRVRAGSPNNSLSVSPPPISSSYYPSAPQMLLALSTGGLSVKPEKHSSPVGGTGTGCNSSRKRFRTKFSQEQKDKMYSFSEKLGWKMQKRDEVMVEEFCNEVGVGKCVLKVWMHNNKHTFGKRDVGVVNGSCGGIGIGSNLHNNTVITSLSIPNNNNNNNDDDDNLMNRNNSHESSAHVGTNCSSSSS